MASATLERLTLRRVFVKNSCDDAAASPKQIQSVQIMANSHDRLAPKKVVEEGEFPYFREI